MNLKLLISPIIGAALLMSCGGSEDTGTKAEVVPEKPKCNCTDVMEIEGKAYANGDIYTGLCEELDERNTVVKKSEFVNGILIYNWRVQNVAGKYLTTDSVHCSSAGIQEGFQLQTTNRLNVVYVERYMEYKAGKKSDKNISFFHGSSIADMSLLSNAVPYSTLLNDDASQDAKTFLINGMKKANEIDPHFKVLAIN
jgi:hypothetical protein